MEKKMGNKNGIEEEEEENGKNKKHQHHVFRDR